MINTQEFSTEDLKAMVREASAYDGSLDHLEYEENEEEFFNLFYGNNPSEAVRAVFYGDYNYTHEYVRINVYGNLESKTADEYEEELEENREDIVDEYIRLVSDGSIDDYIMA